MNIENDKERARGREIMRLLDLGRNKVEEELLDAALDGRERTIQSVSQLYGFVLRSFGSESAITMKFWNAMLAYVSSTTLTESEIEKIHSPLPQAGGPGFRSALDEVEEERK